MIHAVADTHAVIWYLFDDERLSRPAKHFMDETAKQGEQIGFSAITMVEIVYLIEKARIKPNTLKRLLEAIEESDAVLMELPVTRETALNLRSISRASVPDMPDRIIAATALEQKVPIISRDGKIKVSGLKTIW